MPLDITGDQGFSFHALFFAICMYRNVVALYTRAQVSRLYGNAGISLARCYQAQSNNTGRDSIEGCT